MKKALSVLLVCLFLLSFASFATAEGMVTVYNWEEYISPDAIKLFEEETGITVNMTYFTTNEDMMVQVRNSPASYINRYQCHHYQLLFNQKKIMKII